MRSKIAPMTACYRVSLTDNLPPENRVIIAFGAPERTRTPDTRFRKPLLYPAELRARMLRTRCRVSIFYTIPPFDVHVNCWQEIRVRTPLLHPFLNS